MDNGGGFSQTLSGINYAPNTVYALTADVDVKSLLSAGVTSLQTAGVGIGLLNGPGSLADSRSPSVVLNLGLLSGTNYQVQLLYTTGAIAPTGNVGISLFDSPSGLAQANLFSNVTFSNVSLDATAIASTSAPEPSSSILLLLGGGCCACAKGMMKRRAQRSADSGRKES